jgi:hypothetical protein
MQVSATSSGDPIVLIVSYGTIRVIGCLVVLVLAHVWCHSVL